MNMTYEELVAMLMWRDNMSRSEVEELIDECREELIAGDDYAIEEYLGLEDDYIFTVMGY